MNARSLTQITAVVLTATLSLSAAGCGYRIDYRMSEANTPRAADPQPMAVAVALFDDTREIAERSQDGCERAGLQDCGDRTKDKDFRGTVAWEISRVVADHLTWARSFDRVELFPYRTAALTPAVLDSLNGAGIDAVLTGSVDHFVGYYDQHPGTQLLTTAGLAAGLGFAAALLTTETEESTVEMPFQDGFTITETKINPLAISLAAMSGGLLGSLLESTGRRDVDGHALLTLRLLDTKTGQILWAGTAESQDNGHRSMPGFDTAKRKQELALASLRAAVNNLVRQIESFALAEAAAGPSR